MDSHWLIKSFVEHPGLGEETPGSASETRLGGGVDGISLAPMVATRDLMNSPSSGTAERAFMVVLASSLSRCPGFLRATERALRKGETTGGLA